MEYEHVHCTRRCAATGRELRPGEAFYSVLTDEAAKLVRQDYSAEAWTGPPADLDRHSRKLPPDTEKTS